MDKATVLEDEVADTLKIVGGSTDGLDKYLAEQLEDPAFRAEWVAQVEEHRARALRAMGKTDSALEKAGSKATKWATRIFVIVLTIVALLVIVAYWQYTQMKVDNEFNRLFPDLIIAASLL